MEFPKIVTIEACEGILGSFDDLQNDQPLILPVGASAYAFGGLTSAIQTANTWARLSKNRALKLTPSTAKNEITKAIQSPHKFSAAMLAKSIVRANKAASDLRPQVHNAAKSSIERQAKKKYGQQRGGLCWFAFVDHSTKGFDRNFYIEKLGQKPQPRQPAQFHTIIKAMVDKSMAVAGGAKPLDHETLEHLGRIFYELFLNSHEHGTRDFKRSKWVKPGVRIICTHSINLSKEGALGITDKQPILSAYLDSIEARQGKDNKKRFVEISIVDSGLGFCDRWKADHHEGSVQQDVSIQEEYDIFKKCFTFRQTSTKDGNKGHGLPAVMDRLTTLSGFMRVRSGHLALYRDFVATPYLSDDACEFSDWSTAKPAGERPALMPSAAGVAITLMIPLEAK